MIAAFFDVDKTMLPRASMESLFVYWLIQRRAISPKALGKAVRALAIQIRHVRNRGYFAYHGYLEGKTVAEVERLADECFRETIWPRFSPDALRRFSEHKSRGHYSVVLSGSLLVLVRHLADRINADLSIATTPEIIDDRYTGKLALPHVVGPRKAEVAREAATQYELDLPGSYCYADNRSDVTLLDLFGHPVAVNPDRRLREIAQERGWVVEHFC